jgi:hypothetical protein
MILFKKRESRENLLRAGVCSVSASMEEKQHFAALSSEAKDAYVISKILCGERVCPSVLDVAAEKYNPDNYGKSQCFAIISSYMLKNCLFYAVEELQRQSITHSPVTVHTYVCEIFQKLLQFSNQGNFPCYMFPDISLFTNHGSDLERSNQACKLRAMYAKLILNILGKNVDFDEIRLHTFREIKTLSTLTFIKNDNICANCKKSPEEDKVILRTCSRCKLWTYCSDECKERNIERHKPACDYHYKQLSQKRNDEYDVTGSANGFSLNTKI